MANVQTPHKEVVVKTPSTSPQEKKTYCILCRLFYFSNVAQEHVHSMLHHRELEAVLGKDSGHKCHACKVSDMSLYDYAQHISTRQHQVNLEFLMSKNVKPASLFKTVSKETIGMILQRNKALKKVERKAKGKKKKKLKQEAGQRRAQMLQGATRQQTPSKVIKQEKFLQMKMGESKQRQETQHIGSNNAVIQNKENKVSGLQRPLHHTESTLQNQSTRFSCVSGDRAGPSWHHPYVRDQFPQSAHHPMYDNLSVNTEFRVDAKHSKREVFLKTPHKAHRGGTEAPQQITRPGVGQYSGDSWQYSSAADNEFTTDHLPQTGALIFDHDQDESMRSSHPPQESSHGSAQPASDSKAAAIRDVDVSAMLRQIRRALGVREPCRADREARRQNSKAGDGEAVGTTTQQAKAEVEQPACSSEPNTTSAPKARIAHKPGKAQRGDTERTNKLLSLSEVKRRKATGKPRFGIELAKRPTDQESLPLPEDYDLPLSEGFHWESFPDSLSGPHLSLHLPPPLQSNTTHADRETETQPDSQVQEPLEQPDPAQEICSYQTEVRVKVEPNVQPENGGLRDNSVSKRKRNKEVDISGKEPSVKKKKTMSNKDQDQMDQLLTVSLREEELSHSLQDLDKSLIQARNALTAAYAEVQRLLLLRQQCTAEVNSLRAKRIEILQGMQEGYSGASNVTERATTSSAGAAATLQLPAFPSPSAFITSSSPQPPAASPALPVTQSLQPPLALPALSLKQEMCHLPVAGQAANFTSTVSDAPQVPLNQPVSLFPSGLLPSLLLTQSHLVTPTPPPPAAAAAEQPKAQSSTSARTLPSPESPPRQQPETGQGLKEAVHTVDLAKDAETTSEEESARNASKDQRTEAADKSVPEREKNAPVADDKGNESDVSLEMINASNQEVIHIDESDNDDSSEADSDVPEPPQQSVSVEFSFASTQTVQQSDDDRKNKPAIDTSAPAEFVEEEEPSVGSFLNHTGPVHGLQVHEGVLYTCSGDNTARAYSLVTREYLGVFEGHTNKVNCLLVSSVPNMPTRLYTGSSDQTIRCYSIKTKKCLEQITLPDRVLCLHIAWKTLYAGLASGSVASYDVKTLKQLDVFECHGPRGVSCLGTAQEGARRLLLVGSYDSTISVRDAKSGLLLRSLEGHTKTVLCMKVVNDLVFSGSSDTSVHAHNIHTGELVRIYKGHGHAVTSIVILGKVMVTACLDRLVRVYELQSHDRLQVYGGHSDMVMCMAIHKSVIYTGCYDGSVQAVRLNLMKNYRCWWQNCSLIFGMSEHLVQHLTADHTNPKLQMCKCRWRGCDAFFSSQQAVKQELPEHMQSHAENDSRVQP